MKAYCDKKLQKDKNKVSKHYKSNKTVNMSFVLYLSLLKPYTHFYGVIYSLWC